MTDVWEPTTDAVRWEIVKSVLSKDEADELRSRFDGLPKREPNPGDYPASGVWQDFDDMARNIHDRAMEVNDRIFHYELWGMFGMQVAVYDAGHSLKQHHDDTTYHGAPGATGVRMSPLQFRKLSALTMLSDPDEYDGGQLQFDLGTEFYDVKLEKGDTVFFPTHTLHGVTEVTRGRRWVSVVWFTGRMWK